VETILTECRHCPLLKAINFALSKPLKHNLAMSAWFVYIIQSTSGKLYTGITTDVQRRFKEHQSGGKGAKFFRSDKPEKLVWFAQYPDRSAASKEEARIKGWTRRQKIEWIQSSTVSNSSGSCVSGQRS
jgi:putative endonuclease